MESIALERRLIVQILLKFFLNTSCFWGSTPILKHKKLNVFSTILTYLVKSVSFLTFYLVQSSKSTSQFFMYGFLCWRMSVEHQILLYNFTKLLLQNNEFICYCESKNFVKSEFKSSKYRDRLNTVFFPL